MLRPTVQPLPIGCPDFGMRQFGRYQGGPKRPNLATMLGSSSLP
jgi:hypothetical protein